MRMETRTIKELLQVLLDNEEHFEEGLCIFVISLSSMEIINYNEYLLIGNYLRINLPERKYISVFQSDKTPYFSFEYDHWRPRKEWLENEINKL